MLPNCANINWQSLNINNFICCTNHKFKLIDRTISRQQSAFISHKQSGFGHQSPPTAPPFRPTSTAHTCISPLIFSVSNLCVFSISISNTSRQFHHHHPFDCTANLHPPPTSPSIWESLIHQLIDVNTALSCSATFLQLSLSSISAKHHRQQYLVLSTTLCYHLLIMERQQKGLKILLTHWTTLDVLFIRTHNTNWLLHVINHNVITKTTSTCYHNNVHVLRTSKRKLCFAELLYYRPTR